MSVSIQKLKHTLIMRLTAMYKAGLITEEKVAHFKKVHSLITTSIVLPLLLLALITLLF